MSSPWQVELPGIGPGKILKRGVSSVVRESKDSVWELYDSVAK